MPIYHDVAQYSEAYDRLKLGIPTSSHFHKIITPQGKPSKQWREYACVLIAERILQRRLEFYNSPAMERGLIVEADAADWYEFDQDVTAQKIGFITDDNHTVGCSPDRLVGDDGLLEIKAPTAAYPGRILDFRGDQRALLAATARTAVRFTAQLGRYRILARRASQGAHAGRA
jgi:YqaJ-like recombinase protein